MEEAQVYSNQLYDLLISYVNFSSQTKYLADVSDLRLYHYHHFVYAHAKRYGHYILMWSASITMGTLLMRLYLR